MNPQINTNIFININEIKSRISETLNKIKIADDKIKILKEAHSKIVNPSLLKEENENLKLIHQLCLEDLKRYNQKILKLKERFKINESILLKLRKENEQFKKIKNINNQISNTNKNVILNLKDLSRSIGLKTRKDSNYDNANKINYFRTNKIENRININTEKINKIIEEYTKRLNKIKNNSYQISLILEKQNKTIKEYRNYLNLIRDFITKQKQGLNISLNNVPIINNNKNFKLKEFDALNEKAYLLLSEFDNILLESKDNLQQNIENILKNIQTNINKLKLDENKNETNFKNICNEINEIIGVINIIFNDFNNLKNIFDSKKKIFEEHIKKMKDLQNQIIIQNKKEIKNNNGNNNLINEKNNNFQNLKNINDDRKRKIIEQSFLLNAKNASKKLELYKTINLFNNDNKSGSDLSRNQFKTNYHVICYMYDDYNMYDIYYVLKIFNLKNGYKIDKSFFSFDINYVNEIQELSLNDIPSNYLWEGKTYISFVVNLSNLESMKVHIKYKATKNLEYLNNNEIEKRKLSRNEYFRLDSDLCGEKVKYSLILKGSFDIINFEEGFLIRNINNKEETEYSWGGVVPYGGKNFQFVMSKREAIWSFNQELVISFEDFIEEATLYLPVYFVGGNNEIISIKPSSPQTTDIILDEENRKYIFKYINTNNKEIKINIKGEFKNNCKAWNVDLTDEQIEKFMFEEDVEHKDELKIIAKKIIDEFDKNNQDSDFEYLDFMKIGLWVHKNIQYDVRFVGAEFSALEILKIKRGVCEHLTRLANALLYSLGYKVIFVIGYCAKENAFTHDFQHAFSLIKLGNNQWFPFDSTWGIFTGKLPIGHIFLIYQERNLKIETNNKVISNSFIVNGKLIK